MKLNFDISIAEFKIVNDLLKKHLPNNCKVWVFGSRAKKQSKFNSDLDLALDCPDKIDFKSIIQLKEDLEESKLPYTVDVVNFYNIEESFKKIINQHKILFFCE
ncbi:MAG: nucleotidyltransferase domain-containing protein [Bdellovibrionales bacterium]|nr:nucleotidyltransferase domain-containing protein [Bdellovibrionales bacterium]